MNKYAHDSHGILQLLRKVIHFTYVRCWWSIKRGGVRKVRKPQNRTKNNKKPQYRIEIYRNTETAIIDFFVTTFVKLVFWFFHRFIFCDSFCCTDLCVKSNRDWFLCDFALPLMHKLEECPMSSHSGLLAYSALSYSNTVGGCPVPECIAVSWAHIDVCERYHERNLRHQQRSLRFGIPRLPACMVECSPTCMVCLYGRMQPNLSPVLLDIRTTPLPTHTSLQPLYLTYEAPPKP